MQGLEGYQPRPQRVLPQRHVAEAYTLGASSSALVIGYHWISSAYGHPVRSYTRVWRAHTAMWRCLVC
ncbi:MAG TPA: hypothetical protein EYP33_04100 [Pyrodictium sp.]|nr:hypothetical protein [Pyrodictium sp.]